MRIIHFCYKNTKKKLAAANCCHLMSLLNFELLVFTGNAKNGFTKVLKVLITKCTHFSEIFCK